MRIEIAHQGIFIQCQENTNTFGSNFTHYLILPDRKNDLLYEMTGKKML